MEIVNQFTPKLTNDARNKRKKIGFIREPITQTNGNGLWTEVEPEPVAAAEPLAATGTDNNRATQANSHSAQSQEAQAPYMTVPFRVITDNPGQANQTAPASSNNPAPAANPVSSNLPGGQPGTLDRLGNPLSGSQVIPPASSGPSGFNPPAPAWSTPMWPTDQMPSPPPATTAPEGSAPQAPASASANPAAPAEQTKPEPAKPGGSEQARQDDDDLWDLLPKGW
jgi:hypothetical protein